MSIDEPALRYKSIERMERDYALEQLAIGGDQAVAAIYSIALYDPDGAFAESTCFAALETDDPKLLYAAIGAIGEMTVFAGRSIDFRAAEDRLIEIREDHPELSSRIDDSLEDFLFAKARQTQSGSHEL